MKRRDINVELLRIIGCLIIVGVHTCLYQIVDDRADIGRTFISCLLADGVAIFWMITGFFLFSNKSYIKVLKHALRHIGIPVISLSIVVFYFGDWIMWGQESLTESLYHPISDYKEVIRSILSWSNAIDGLGHLWYLYVYLMVMAAFPVLKAFVDYLGQDSKREVYFVIITLGFFVINDITGNRLASFSHHSINGAVPASIEIIWGHIIYKHRDIFKNKKYLFGSIAIFLILNILRTGIQVNNFSLDFSDKHILYWYTSIGILCAVCVIAFCFSFDINSIGIRNIIARISSCTFLIYLLHPLVKNTLSRFDIQNQISAAVVRGSFISECLYTIIMILLLFMISLFIAAILKLIKYLWLRIVHYKDAKVASQKY